MGLFLVLFAVLFWFCFWSVFGFELSHSLLFTQKLWRFSGLSERALDLLLGLCLGVPSISRLFNLDCRYPRDQLQPARKKKQPFTLRTLPNLLFSHLKFNFPSFGELISPAKPAKKA